MYIGAYVCYRFCQAIVISSCFVHTRWFCSIMSHSKCEDMKHVLNYMTVACMQATYLVYLCKFSVLNCCK